MTKSVKEIVQCKKWLVETGARYVWTEQSVLVSRHVFYENVSQKINNPNQWVVSKIADRIRYYITSFDLEKSWNTLKS
jgi:hypothetical protein